jgi:hypothetical protein
MPEPDVAALLAFFKAMANESRLRIVGLLSDRERSVQELAGLLELKEPTVSHHLAALKRLGLVSVRAEGVVHWHRLRPEALTEFSRAMFDPDTVPALARPPTKSKEERVLAAFVGPDGAFTRLPASRGKRWVLLSRLAEEFEEDRRYREAEVNEILQRRHWDSATMRREMVGWRMLARDKGVYWRLPRAEWQAA